MSYQQHEALFLWCSAHIHQEAFNVSPVTLGLYGETFQRGRKIKSNNQENYYSFLQTSGCDIGGGAPYIMCLKSSVELRLRTLGINISLPIKGMTSPGSSFQGLLWKFLWHLWRKYHSSIFFPYSLWWKD